METKTLPKQEFLVRNLSARSVVLYPTRAHVVREIRDIQLEHGINEIEIYGLTPTADEGSIKVEGTGDATISNMTVELVSNREIFEEIYPEDESEVEESEDEDSDPEDEKIETIMDTIKSLENEHGHTKEVIASVAKRLEALDSYARSAHADKVDAQAFESVLGMYKEQRNELHHEHDLAVAKGERLQIDIAKSKRELKKASKPMRFDKKKQEKAKLKKSLREARIKAEGRKEKKRLKDEHIKFWPKKVYKINLHLETAVETPSTSRRTSVSSITLAKETLSAKPLESHADGRSNTAQSVSLALSYVTTEASWVPRYDASFSTPTKTGTIVYRAEFNNHTSETWKDARISLSTSQASFQGVNDEVPYMYAWPVGLSRIGIKTGTKASSGSDQLALNSSQEVKHRNEVQSHYKGSTSARGELFGLGENNTWAQSQKAQVAANVATTAARKFKSVANTNNNTASFGGSLFGNSQDPAISSHYRGAFSSVQVSQGNQAPQQPQMAFRRAVEDDESQGEDETAFDALAHRNRGIDDVDASNQLDFEESAWEDNGLTTTYDIPGLRTLRPSSTKSQHKIATLNFKELQLTSIAVPKLRAAAFMRARFRNPSSSVTLLKGKVGLTLDGTFLGTTTLPRVSPHEIITLPLGVDPAVHIAYSKPSLRRATQGLLFNKENLQSFTRNIWISNTKTTPTELLVLDQVPVSEDEKLRVDITTPAGLTKEGSRASCGTAASESAASKSSSGPSLKRAKNWGSAFATLRKNNEIRFDVTLEKGASCRLLLEYDLRAPAGEIIASR